MNTCYEAPLYHFHFDFTFFLHRSKWAENAFIHLNRENETVQAFCSIIHIKKRKTAKKISFFTSGTSVLVFKSTQEKNENQKNHVRSKEVVVDLKHIAMYLKCSFLKRFFSFSELPTNQTTINSLLSIVLLSFAAVAH